jgi:hypothetical protein
MKICRLASYWRSCQESVVVLNPGAGNAARASGRALAARFSGHRRTRGQAVRCLGKHSLLGRMYLPAYRASIEAVAPLRRRHPANEILPAIYGCSGLVDVVTVDEVLKCNPVP